MSVIVIITIQVFSIFLQEHLSFQNNDTGPRKTHVNNNEIAKGAASVWLTISSARMPLMPCS